jgi:uncharacterized protein YbaA (DUF1428 family)
MNNQYIDGFVLPVPTDKIDIYQAIAEKACAIFMDHGALEYRECVGDDFDAKGMLPFPALAKALPEETVVFAWITYRSREHRDEVNAKIHQDPRMIELMNEGCPFDPERMAYGGFKTIVKD